jgi:hypothetical protein
MRNLIYILLFIPFVGFAQTSATESPGTITEYVGSWSDLSNAGSQDDTYAEIMRSGDIGSAYFTNFGFSISTGATINGIVVEGDWYRASTVSVDYVYILLSDGSEGAENKSDEAAAIATTDSDTYDAFGGSSDLWGETWVASDINDIDFGVLIGFNVGESDPFPVDGYIYVDHIKITVYYTETTSIGKVSGLAYSSTANVSGVAKASIAKIMGIE